MRITSAQKADDDEGDSSADCDTEHECDLLGRCAGSFRSLHDFVGAGVEQLNSPLTRTVLVEVCHGVKCIARKLVGRVIAWG